MASSNPSTFLGMEAMNNGYFMVGGGGGMTSTDVTPFHPSMLLEHGSSLGFGFGSAAVTVAELGPQFAATNVVLASFANHLSVAVPARPQEEMDCGLDVAGGDSCSAASLQQCHGQSGGMAVWSSSCKTPYGASWSSASDAVGFHYPLLACGGGSAPAASELSLTLCSKSSSDSGLNATDQCSSVTELPPARATFAVVAARSRYAAAAQEVLNDIVGHLLDGVADESGGGIDSWSVDASSVVSSNRFTMALSEDGGDAGARWGAAQQRVRTDLLNMLQMLDQKYNQCLDEVLSTTAKFNGLIQQGGAGNASICAPFAHRAVAAMYRGLRRRIAGEIMGAAACRPACWGESSSATAGDVDRSWESALIQKHWAMQRARRGEQQCWRPQRGLPERSVGVLKGWMFEHFLKPYPDDHDKDMLAARSGLTRNQVSNWFINARVRIWKPMIEEMYQDLKRSSAGEQGMEMETQQLEQSNMLSA